MSDSQSVITDDRPDRCSTHRERLRGHKCQHLPPCVYTVIVVELPGCIGKPCSNSDFYQHLTRTCASGHHQQRNLNRHQFGNLNGSATANYSETQGGIFIGQTQRSLQEQQPSRPTGIYRGIDWNHSYGSNCRCKPVATIHDVLLPACC